MDKLMFYLNIFVPGVWQLLVIYEDLYAVDNAFVNNWLIWPLSIFTTFLLIISSVVMLISINKVRMYYKGTSGQLNQTSLSIHAAIFGLYAVVKTWMMIRKDIQDTIHGVTFVTKLASTLSFATQILMAYVMAQLSVKKIEETKEEKPVAVNFVINHHDKKDDEGSPTVIDLDEDWQVQTRLWQQFIRKPPPEERVPINPQRQSRGSI